MQGLFEAVARDTLAIYAEKKGVPPTYERPGRGPAASGWDLHIAFGLAHPDAFALLFSAPTAAAYKPVIREGVALLQGLVARVAEAGRLRVDVAHATNLIHAAGTGVKLTLAATPAEERDPRLSETNIRGNTRRHHRSRLRRGPERGPDAAPAAERVAVHAVALRALLTEAPSVLSPAERQLLNDWLDRLAIARNQV